MKKIKAFIAYLEEVKEEQQLCSNSLSFGFSPSHESAISILQKINAVAERMAKDASVLAVSTCERNRYRVQVRYDAFIGLVEECHHEPYDTNLTDDNKICEHYKAYCDGFTLVAVRRIELKKENASA